MLLGIVAGAFFFLTQENMQMWIMKHGIEYLSEKLQTRVSADSIGVDMRRGHIFLYGFEIDDRNQVTMLRVDTLDADMQLTELLKNRAVINHVTMNGAKAVLYKEHPDSAANYQFVIDAFKKDKKKKANKDKAKSKKMEIALDGADFHRLQLRWNSNDYSLQSLKYDGAEQRAHIKGLLIKTDNHKPRKNEGKPNRGAFDAGHLNLTANLDITLLQYAKDTVSMCINHLDAEDDTNGIYIKDMNATIHMKGKELSMVGFSLDFGKATHIGFDILHATYDIIPGDKEKGIKKKVNLEIKPSKLHAHVDLQDIAKPFAPVLSHFTTPLDLQVTVSGNPKRFDFRKITITNPDSRLRIKANGDLCNVAEKKNLCLHFNNISLDARHGIKETVINHFAKKVKLKMIRQMQAVGDIRFDGSLGIFYKREHIGGNLQTKFGNVNVNFTLNGITKYMTGTISTDSLEIGQIMNVKGVGPVKAKATYSFDTASGKKHKMEGKHHGRLPIGWMKADIDNAKYKFIHFKHITADIKSDGTTAKGLIYVPQKLFDIVTLFHYTQTDQEQKIDIKPSITKHHKESITLEEKEKQIEEKEKKREEKEKEKEKKREEKQKEKEKQREEKQKEKEKR